MNNDVSPSVEKILEQLSFLTPDILQIVFQRLGFNVPTVGGVSRDVSTVVASSSRDSVQQSHQLLHGEMSTTGLTQQGGSISGSTPLIQQPLTTGGSNTCSTLGVQRIVVETNACSRPLRLFSGKTPSPPGEVDFETWRILAQQKLDD